MNTSASFGQKPRRISIVVDNPSWVLPFAERLAGLIAAAGNEAKLCREHNDVDIGEVAFYLGCVHVASPDILARNKWNLVVHASDLPKGRGFSPLTWLVLDGRNTIPVCLLHAAEKVDSGPIVYRDEIQFEGHELIGEMRRVLGEKTIELCLRYLSGAAPQEGAPQKGEPTHLRRRRPEDSRLDPHKSIAEQFNLLRTVDNDAYPAHFDLFGCRYILRISKADRRNDA